MKRFVHLKGMWAFPLLGCLLALLFSCTERASSTAQYPRENQKAKSMLQGVWMNEDDESLAFRAKGDTIYYPDSTSIPVYFRILGDTLLMGPVDDAATYAIVKQTPHLFAFKNQNGDVVRLVKTEDHSYLAQFEQAQRLPVNQNKLIKKDSVIIYGTDRYHYYIQVNPTSYKVVKDTYNSDGVEVGNVYFDNIVHLSLFRGARQLFSKDFRTRDFSKLVPPGTLRQSVLSDLRYRRTDTSGFHFMAYVVVPDSPTSYLIEITVSFSGEMQMKV